MIVYGNQPLSAAIQTHSHLTGHLLLHSSMKVSDFKSTSNLMRRGYEDTYSPQKTPAIDFMSTSNLMRRREEDTKLTYSPQVTPAIDFMLNVWVTFFWSVYSYSYTQEEKLGWWLHGGTTHTVSEPLKCGQGHDMNFSLESGPWTDSILDRQLIVVFKSVTINEIFFSSATHLAWKGRTF